MRLLHLHIERFRGIRELDWTVPKGLVCLVGPCDSKKTTVLDAIEFALTDRWNLSFTDGDFFDSDTSQPFIIRATVGGLPGPFLAENRLGHYAVGWDDTQNAVTENPDSHHEFVLAIQLEVSESLEPSWYVLKGDVKEPLRSHDRKTLGATRLGSEIDRHLTWARNSALTRMTDESIDTKPVLLNALRAAKLAADQVDDTDLNTILTHARKAAQQLGVVPKRSFRHGLDIRTTALGGGILTIHDGDVSMLRAGLGTRRLLALGIQRHSVQAGAILLIDEIEHGLEPFRLRKTLRTLRGDCADNQNTTSTAITDAATKTGKRDDGEKPSTVGQVILTSHSSTTVVELSASEVSVVRADPDGHVDIRRVTDDLQDIVRSVPEALLAPRVIICEGKTEYGICLALDAYWTQSLGMSAALHGVAIVEGGGHKSPKAARTLRELGYDTLWFGDADDRTIDDAVADLGSIGCEVIRWSSPLRTEDILFRDLPVVHVSNLIDFAIGELGESTVLDQLKTHLPKREGVSATTPAFDAMVAAGYATDQIRIALGKASASKQKSWFKRIDRGEYVGTLIASQLETDTSTELNKKVGVLRAWIYGP